MIKLDDNLLTELGLGAMPKEEKAAFLKHMYSELELRVGTRLAERMSDEQMRDFEQFISSNDEQGAFHWLESNFPDYKDVVASEFDKLKAEIQPIAGQIVASSMAGGDAGAATGASAANDATTDPPAAGPQPSPAYHQPMPPAPEPAPAHAQPQQYQPPQQQPQPSPPIYPDYAAGAASYQQPGPSEPAQQQPHQPPVNAAQYGQPPQTPVHAASPHAAWPPAGGQALSQSPPPQYGFNGHDLGDASPAYNTGPPHPSYAPSQTTVTGYYDQPAAQPGGSPYNPGVPADQPQPRYNPPAGQGDDTGYHPGTSNPAN